MSSITNSPGLRRSYSTGIIGMPTCPTVRDTFSKAESTSKVKPSTLPEKQPEKGTKIEATAEHGVFDLTHNGQKFVVTFRPPPPDTASIEKLASWIGQLTEAAAHDNPDFKTATIDSKGQCSCNGKPWMPSKQQHVQRLVKWIQQMWLDWPYEFDIKKKPS